MGRALGLAPAVALVAGCGTDVRGAPPALDAAPHADAAAGPITVRVLVTDTTVATPEAGVRVLFVAPAGAAVLETTDADGVARAAMPDGATVVVARGTGLLRQITAFFAVPPGASLIDGPQPVAVGASLGLRTATVPPTDAPQLALRASCGQQGFGQGTEVVWNAGDCPRARDATVVVAAEGQPTPRYAIATGVDLVRDAPVVMGRWQDPRATDVILTNLPPDITDLAAQRVQLDRGDVLDGRSASVAVEGASTIVPLAVAPMGDRAEVTTTLFKAGRLVLAGHQLVAGDTPRVVVEVGGRPPAPLTAIGYDPETGTLAWGHAGAGASAHAYAAVIGLQSLTAVYQVRVVAPGDVGAVRLPPLPPELVDVAPPTAPTSIQVTVAAVRLDAVLPYDALATRLDDLSWRTWLGSPFLHGTDLDGWIALASQP